MEKEEWIEVYTMNGTGLILEKTRFKAYGAGVPSTGPTTFTEDGFVEMDIQREMERISLVVSPLVQSSLTTKSGRTYLLYKLVDPYEEVHIQPVHLSVYSYVVYLIEKGGISRE